MHTTRDKFFRDVTVTSCDQAIARLCSACCTGMHLARNHANPEYRTRGAFGGPHMVALTSEHAHYSYLKAAFLTGAVINSELHYSLQV